MNKIFEFESESSITKFPQRIVAKDYFFNGLYKITVHHIGEFYIEKKGNNQEKSFSKKSSWFLRSIKRLFNVSKKNYIPDYLLNIVDNPSLLNSINKLKEFVGNKNIEYASFWFTPIENEKVLFYNGYLKYPNERVERPISSKTFSSILKGLGLLEAKTVFNRNFRNLSEYKWLLNSTKIKHKINYLAMKLENEETFKNYYL